MVKDLGIDLGAGVRSFYLEEPVFRTRRGLCYWLDCKQRLVPLDYNLKEQIHSQESILRIMDHPNQLEVVLNGEKSIMVDRVEGPYKIIFDHSKFYVIQ